MSNTGAHFRKTDLQIHSPRDEKWDGARPEASLRKIKSPTSDQIHTVRREWANSLIQASLDRRLRAIAVTDHHEGVYVWEIITAVHDLRAEGNDPNIWVFPGMELSTKDGAQAIIIFDCDIPPALFTKARAILRLPSACNENADRGIVVEPLSYNVEQLQEVLAADDELRDRFIILPNITPGGHKTVLRKGLHKRFKDMPYIGGYLDGQYPDSLKDQDRQKLDGEIPAWGSQRRAIIATSDAREADFRNLGRFSTWIKVAAPTAESLRQAMLAADSRIRYTEPLPPNVSIHSVHVEGATFLAVGSINFNAQYNAIIGGRGAGKSTLLEFIRFALGLSALDSASDEWDPTHERRKDILQQALTPDSGAVAVTVNMDGALIKFRRSRKTPESITMDVSGKISILPPKDVRTLVPVQAFSQGELSHLGQDKAEARLMELVTAPAREEFAEITNQLATASDELVRQLGRRVTAWSLEQKKRRAEASIETTEARLKALQGDLSTNDPEATAVVQSHSSYERTDEFFRVSEEAAIEVSTSVTAAIQRGSSRVTHAYDIAPSSDTVEVEIVTRALNDLRQRLRRASNYVAAGVERFRTAHATASHFWDKNLEIHKQQYQDALEKLTDHQVVAEQIQLLDNELGELKTDLESFQGQLLDVADAESAFNAAMGTHQEWQRSRINLTRNAAATVAVLSGGLAKAEVVETGDVQQVHTALVTLFQGTGVREARLRAYPKSVQSATLIG
jgi:chromosome segregation protein